MLLPFNQNPTVYRAHRWTGSCGKLRDASSRSPADLWKRRDSSCANARPGSAAQRSTADRLQAGATPPIREASPSNAHFAHCARSRLQMEPFSPGIAQLFVRRFGHAGDVDRITSTKSWKGQTNCSGHKLVGPADTLSPKSCLARTEMILYP